MSAATMTHPRLNLVDGTLALLTAAVEDRSALERLLGASIADDWEGFPEALPVLCASYKTNPEGHRWGSLFFIEPEVRMLVGFGGFKGPPSSDAVVEIGYAIAPRFRGKGLATDAVAQMVRRAFVDTTVRAVDAHTLGQGEPIHSSPREVGISQDRRVRRPKRRASLAMASRATLALPSLNAAD